MRCCAGFVAVALLSAAATEAAGQSTLERTPNLSGGWVAEAGALSFNFVHRFNHSGAPQRQVQNRPTFLLAWTAPFRTMAGVSYTTRSALVAGVPNEWQPFIRVRPFDGDRLGVGVEAAWNEAARSLDGELSATLDMGRLRPMAAVRVLGHDAAADDAAFVLAGGLVLRLHEHVALAGDAGRRWSDADDTRVFWGAGLHLRIPQSPHTLSFHAVNTDAATLQAASRAAGAVRYGFEFTIPFTPARYFGGSGARGAAVAGDTVALRSLQFQPARIRVRAGTRVTWRNEDAVEHSVTAADRSWDSGNIAPNGTFSREFTTRGTFEIVCTPHPFMKMEVIVE